MAELVRVGDLDFTVDLYGPDDGAPVLMLHGFPQSRAAWRAQGAALAQAGFRAIAPDQRGYSAGARPAGIEPYAAANIVGDALGLMDALGHETFHLVGHDWGGQIAWLTAVRAPERIRSLAVLSRPHPAAFARAFAQDPAQAARSGHHRSLQDDAAVAGIRAGDFAGLRAMFAGAGVPAATAGFYIDTLSPPGAIEAAIAWYRAGGAGALRAADVPPVGARTLYVWGDADTTVGRMAAEATADFVTGPYRFEAIGGAGHFLTDEVPDAVNRLLLEHLGGVA
ncbi:MAG: alpha/beta hydrolase [Phenylobacterium sp.]|uniref:alpha/beta fold hydrolase n=1 Tax=Phenylobacterium sp. TaxID=1871053 RepID=UPI001A4FCF34|nr:alpha/beta hydrolase [Phenylobacterium sp.]MBL8555629.1 alpha/beta hydrolase [Phenylobacterium sp.]